MQDSTRSSRFGKEYAKSLGLPYDPTFAARVLEEAGMLDRPCCLMVENEFPSVRPWTPEELAGVR